MYNSAQCSFLYFIHAVLCNAMIMMIMNYSCKNKNISKLAIIRTVMHVKFVQINLMNNLTCTVSVTVHSKIGIKKYCQKDWPTGNCLLISMQK